jgi:uncharacterized RDD family membrane protein YckC
MPEKLISENTKLENVQYAKFWNRVGAYLIDVIIVGGFSAIINYLNITNYKSFLFYLPIAIIGFLYKPYMESKYGATLGKMALDLKVTDHNFNQINFTQSLMRSIILVFPVILSVPIYYLAFNNPILANITGVLEFAQALTLEYPIQSWIGNLSLTILVIDIIVLLTDKTKTQKSLHDRIGKTFVIIDRK